VVEDRPLLEVLPAQRSGIETSTAMIARTWRAAGHEVECAGRANNGSRSAIKWTRLSCRTFAANVVRLQLHALAYNLGNFLRTLATLEPIKDWSLTSGAKVVSHGRQHEAFDCHAFKRNRLEECVQMPVKIARSTPRPSFGLPELLVASHISRLASRHAAKSLPSTLVSESSGESRVATRVNGRRSCATTKCTRSTRRHRTVQ
jgi:hypothetical protein